MSARTAERGTHTRFGLPFLSRLAPFGVSGRILGIPYVQSSASGDLYRLTFSLSHFFGFPLPRLLLQREAEFHALPQRWLDQLLAFLRRPDQELTDITRRSAGLPFALTSVFSAEPGASRRLLLQRGMAELLATAADAAAEQPWPRVHALNAARAAFNDRDLATSTAPFFAQGAFGSPPCRGPREGLLTASAPAMDRGQESSRRGPPLRESAAAPLLPPFPPAGLQICVDALAAPQWEVRNAATQCYTAMLVRVLGFRNLTTKASAIFFKFYQQVPWHHRPLGCRRRVPNTTPSQPVFIRSADPTP